MVDKGASCTSSLDVSFMVGQVKLPTYCHILDAIIYHLGASSLRKLPLCHYFSWCLATNCFLQLSPYGCATMLKANKQIIFLHYSYSYSNYSFLQEYARMKTILSPSSALTRLMETQATDMTAK
jgi:hypothetical protein